MLVVCIPELKQTSLTHTQFFNFMRDFEKRAESNIELYFDAVNSRLDKIEGRLASLDHRLDMFDNRLNNELSDIKRTQQAILDKLDKL